MDNVLSREIKRIKNLKQNKNKDTSIIEKQAQKNLWIKQANISERFKSSEDKTLAEKIFGDYLENYVFDAWSDVQNVADLVFEEITKLKIQIQISEITADKNIKFIPDKLIDSLHKVEEKIYELKEKAGIAGGKVKEDLSALQEYEKKLKVYIPFNRNEFTLWSGYKCASCGNKDTQPLLIRRRCDKNKFDVLKHPFFSGRFWYNRRGMKLVKEKIWTKEQYAWVFQTSVQYVDWCLENEHKIVEIDEVEEEKIKEFINNKTYLKEEKIPSNIRQ